MFQNVGYQTQNSESVVLSLVIINTLGICLVNILGLFVNIFSAKIWHILATEKDAPPGCFSFTILIRHLIYTDICLNICSLFFYFIPVLFYYFGGAESGATIFLVRFNYPFLYSILCTIQMYSTGILLAATYEKFKNTTEPFWAIVYCTRERGLWISGGVFISAILFNIPRWWEWNCHSRDQSKEDCLNSSSTGEIGIKICTDNSVLTVASTDLLSNPYYVNFYWILGSTLFNYVIPVILMTWLNYFIMNQIRNVNSRVRLNKLHVFHNIAGLELLFCLCKLADIVIVVLLGNNVIVDTTVILISNVFLSFNSSLKFFVFFYCGDRFPEIARELAAKFT